MTTRYRTAWTFVVTSAALFMASLDNLVVTTALPSIRDHLHASLEGLQWTVNAYTLTFAVLLLTGATLGERYGRRRLFVIGLGVFTAGSAAAALAPGIGWLIAARALQGVGAAVLIPLTLTLLSAAVPPARRGLALGAWGAVRRDQEGIASGANNAIRELGGVFGIAVLGAVFSARGGYSSGAAFVSGMSSAV